MHKDTEVKDLNSETTTEEVTKRLDELSQRRGGDESASEPDIPLFLRYSSEGEKGDAQDEKDKSAE